MRSPPTLPPPQNLERALKGKKARGGGNPAPSLSEFSKSRYDIK